MINFFWSLFAGRRAERNPWQANTLEWVAPTPTPHGNFEAIPTVYRGPYEYSSPEVQEDYLPQDRPLAAGGEGISLSACAPCTAVWLHRFALLTTLATFPLLFVGGLVTSTGSALAVPDWPTTFGHNMFLYPLSGMVGGILYEHSHRLLGALVGFLTIILSALVVVERVPTLAALAR